MSTADTLERPRFRIIHETNPVKYYPALLDLATSGEIEIAGLHRGSVGKEWIRSGLQERRSVAERTANSWSDLKFRLGAGDISGETIMVALAPWDYRLLYYRHLVRRNRVLYHTSWLDWRVGKVPRNYGPLDAMLIPVWRTFLNHPNVSIVAVTDPAAASLRTEMGVENVRVIPHCAEQCFYEAGAKESVRTGGPLRLLYVGELSEKKGLRLLLELVALLPRERFTLTIVGDGPLRDEVAARVSQIDNATFTGPVRDRRRLADLMAAQDVLLVPSQRMNGWQELFGMVIVEAMAAGLVVCASDHVGPRSILSQKAPDTLFEAGDSNGIMRFLERVESDEGYRSDLRRRCRDIAGKYRLSRVRDDWRELIFNARG